MNRNSNFRNYLFIATILVKYQVLLYAQTAAFADVQNEFCDMSNSPSCQMSESPINLAADFIDDVIPINLRSALTNALNSATLNQACPNNGNPRFLNAIAKLYSKILNRSLDPNENVLATVGATEALHVAFLGLTDPGDEWIVIEPFYHRYAPMIKLAHGVARFTSLAMTDWRLNKAQLESLLSSKTKGIIINNPNNPTGKSYKKEDLEFIADLARRRNLLVISDEAHEWITFEPNKHLRIASFRNMFERTITIGSAGKTFGITGWRIGWIYGPADILNKLKPIHSNTVHSAPNLLQEAIAVSLEQEIENLGKEDSYFNSNARNESRKRDFLFKSFESIGMIPVMPDAGYCIIVDWRAICDNGNIDYKSESGDDAGTKFNNWLTKNIGVYGAPMSIFYSDEHKYYGENYIRFSFHKKRDTLDKAVARLQKLQSYK